MARTTVHAGLRLLSVPKTGRLPGNSPSTARPRRMPPPPASSKSYARLIFVHRSFSHTWKVSRSEIRPTVRKISLAKLSTSSDVVVVSSEGDVSRPANVGPKVDRAAARTRNRHQVHSTDLGPDHGSRSAGRGKDGRLDAAASLSTVRLFPQYARARARGSLHDRKSS
jgi:hypothetical protein